MTRLADQEPLPDRVEVLEQDPILVAAARMSQTVGGGDVMRVLDSDDLRWDTYVAAHNVVVADLEQAARQAQG